METARSSNQEEAEVTFSRIIAFAAVRRPRAQDIAVTVKSY